jgi:hypothetical protein
MKNVFFFIFLILTQFQLESQNLSKTFPYYLNQQVKSVRPTSDNGYIALLAYDHTYATTSTNILIKTDSNFNTIWSKAVLPLSEIGTTPLYAEESKDGGFVTFGMTGILHSVICKFDSNGNFLWRSTHNAISGSLYEGLHRNQCIEKPNGKWIGLVSYYSNMFVYQLSANGNLEWSKYIDSPLGSGKDPSFDVISLGDGSIVVSGKTNSNNCFARLDSVGNFIWSTIFEIEGTYNRPRAIVEMEDGHIFVAGLTSYSKGFIMKISRIDGSVIWRNEVNDMVFQDAIYVGNDRYATIAGLGEDVLIALFNGMGELINSKKMVGISGLIDIPLLINSHNHFYLTSIKDYSGLRYYINLMEFDSTLNFQCVEQPLTITKVANTSIPLIIGNLIPKDTGTFTRTTTATTLDITSTLINNELCELLQINNSDQLTQPKISIFPNPSSRNSIVTLEIDQNDFNEIQVLDMFGKIILQKSINENKFYLNTSGFNSGMYLIKLISKDFHLSKCEKLIIE